MSVSGQESPVNAMDSRLAQWRRVRHRPSRMGFSSVASRRSTTLRIQMGWDTGLTARSASSASARTGPLRLRHRAAPSRTRPGYRWETQVHRSSSVAPRSAQKRPSLPGRWPPGVPTTSAGRPCTQEMAWLACSMRSTRRMVVIPTPYCWHSCRAVGSESPGDSSPCSICVRMD